MAPWWMAFWAIGIALMTHASAKVTEEDSKTVNILPGVKCRADNHTGAARENMADLHHKDGSDWLQSVDSAVHKLIDQVEKRRRKRQQNIIATSVVGLPCNENIDCLTLDGGAYCDATKRCDCLPTYTPINGFCWQKKSPGETCSYEQQCSATSPNTYCDQSGGTGMCKCSNNQQPTRTEDGDGPFCLLKGHCPTNGPNAALKDGLLNVGALIACKRTDDCRSPSSGPRNYMFNCICPGTAKEEYQLNGCPDSSKGVCCPTRAATCIQPRDEGTFGGGGGSSQRWWYNAASGNCEPLAYRGSGGNANNFETKAFCESYCKTTCPRGSPFTMEDHSPFQTCSTATGCSDDRYFCHTEGTSLAYCCPKPEFVCGHRGGIPFDQLLNPNNPYIPDQFVESPHSGDMHYPQRQFPRYYYDAGDKICKPFDYYGYGGNFNNFQTLSECQAYCASTQCTTGQPLIDQSGIVVKCGIAGSAVCPAKYECTSSGACCPTPNFVCSLPQAIGGCINFAERWWFNPSTRICEKFTYSGCHGNSNNFATYRECVDKCGPSSAQPKCPQGEAAKDSGGINYIICAGNIGIDGTTTPCPSDYYCHFDGVRYGCCPTRAKTCYVDAKDEGTLCITPVTRWYYNSQTRTCETFNYQGCDGNSNNFATKIDCQDYCGVGGCAEGGEPLRESLGSNFRVCGAGGIDCPADYKCTVVTLGTSNRYNYCCPTRASVCRMQQDQGHRCGTTTLQRWYFNAASRICDMFIYNGCGGNRNNFRSSEECFMYCNSAGCPAGQVAMQDVNTKRVTTCDVSQVTNCPSNYRCIMSTVLQQGICCGSNAPPGACPGGEIAHMDSFTNTPLQCQPNVDNSCPNGIFCQFSFALNNAFCCSAMIVQCPQGGDPLFENMVPRQCTPNLPNACPTGYTCQATLVMPSNITSATGYCCGQGNICGAGYMPYYVNNQPVPCVLNQVPGVCPAPFACRQSVNTQQSYCCSAQLTPVCAAGKEPLLNLGAPTLCTQMSPNTGCPSPYTCDLYQQTGSYYCCRIGHVIPTPTPLPGGACPLPYVLLQPIRYCSPGVSGTCPTGYFCYLDQTSSRFVCCGSGDTSPTGYCPRNNQPYINPSTGQPQPCMLGTPTTGCPNGYGCLYSSAYKNYYCCLGGVVPTPNRCPAPFTAAINPSTGQPQTCIVGQPTCPIGYQCLNTASGTALCCGRSTTPGGGDPYGCPAGNAYLYPGTRTPLACTRTGPPCPVGYSCMQSTRTNTFQCCSSVAGRSGVATKANEPPKPVQGQNAPKPIQSPSVPSSTGGRRKCNGNLDCRDRNGNVKLCIRGYCLD